MPNSYLIVVDMQNDFIDGALGTPEAQAIVEGVVERTRAFEGRVVFTRDTHGSNYASTQEGRNLPVPHCIKGTQGWELAPALDENPEAARCPGLRQALVRLAQPRALARGAKRRRAHRLHRTLRPVHRHLRGQQRPHHQGAPAGGSAQREPRPLRRRDPRRPRRRPLHHGQLPGADSVTAREPLSAPTCRQTPAPPPSNPR